MPKIVEATGTASGRQYTNVDVERAMTEAVEKCAAAGITDPGKILEAKMKARAEVTGKSK